MAHADDPQGKLAHRVFYESRYPESPNRPVWNALRGSFLERCDRFDQFVSDQSSEPSTLTCSEAEDRLVEMKAVCREFLELFFWIDPDPPPLSAEDVHSVLSVLKQVGMADYAKYLMKHVGSRSRAGRPATSRDLAIRALELKSSDPTLSWLEAVQRLCPCDKSTHDKQCAELIRREVLRLQEVLKRYSISKPA